jgi:competence protein ComEC
VVAALSAFVAVIIAASLSASLEVLTGGCAIALLGFAIAASRRTFYAATLGVVCALALAALHAQEHRSRALPTECVGAPLALQGRIDSLPLISASPFGGRQVRFEFVLDAALAQPCKGPRRVALSYYGDAPIAYGQAWAFDVRLKRPRGLVNPGGFDRDAWYAMRGIDATGTVRGNGRRLAPEGRWLPRDPSGSWRMQIRAQVGRLPFSADVRGVLRALVIGDKGGIDDTLWQRITRLGINHLFVISGLHVGFVAALGFGLGRLAGALCAGFARSARSLPALTAIAAAALYVALAGYTLPTQRAFIMLCVLLAGSGLGRNPPAFYRLLVAAAVVLALSPLAALGPGFWLSFGSVAALLWLAAWNRDRPWWRAWLGTHAYMMWLMLPLGSAFFGGASLVAMVANGLLVPLVGTVIVPLALLAALAHLAGAWVEWALWLAAGSVLEWTLLSIELVAGAQQGWMFHHPAVTGPGVTLGLVACAALVLPIGRLARAALLVLPLLLMIGPRAAPGDDAERATQTVVTVLDVGQGTAVVIRRGQRALLYDTGGGTPGGYTLAKAVVLPYLRRHGINVLDTFIVSHGDADHSAGVDDILSVLPVARIRYGGQLALAHGRRCRAGEAWAWPGGPVFSVLSPARASDLSSNNGSCVLQVRSGPHTLLLTGDIEGERERELARFWRGALDSDGLLVAHHGSRTSTFWSFLKRVDPTYAVISAGYANRFGHPHPDVTGRLLTVGARQFDTPSSGATTFFLNDDGTVQVRELRRQRRRHWM